MEKKPKIFQNNKIVTKTNSRTSYSDNTKINAYEELNRIFKNNKKICGIELEIITNKIHCKNAAGHIHPVIGYNVICISVFFQREYSACQINPNRHQVQKHKRQKHIAHVAHGIF